ncbi:MAG TPA: SGNH/GDSL hydrolase family protein [Pseudonocardiaceae bacterium]|nr:SGNH/GDSL hydrolase family protein [Pseudonocardiaceae bacterium]
MPVFRRALLTTAGLAATAAALSLAGIPASAGAEPAEGPQHYVALGDSYAAGPGIKEQRADPRGCQRSTNNYPARLAEMLNISDYTDVTCSGATTGNMTASQSLPQGTNPPQFSALREDTDLVTVTITGNDIGFVDIVENCTRVSIRDPWGNPCERQAKASGTDVYADRIEAVGPKLAQVLEGIHQRSPHATVLLVGYLRILPPSIGCYPTFPVSRGDVPYLDGLQQQLTAVLDTQAFRHDAILVDAYARSQGHDACQPPRDRWVEGVLPASPAAPVHPNAAGMEAVAGFARDTLSRHHVAAPVS